MASPTGWGVASAAGHTTAWFGSTKTLDVHIAALRQRLAQAADSFDPAARVPAITTLRGHGYRLEAD